jgi:hypothetical protein
VADPPRHFRDRDTESLPRDELFDLDANAITGGSNPGPSLFALDERRLHFEATP